MNQYKLIDKLWEEGFPEFASRDFVDENGDACVLRCGKKLNFSKSFDDALINPKKDKMHIKIYRGVYYCVGNCAIFIKTVNNTYYAATTVRDMTPLPSATARACIQVMALLNTFYEEIYNVEGKKERRHAGILHIDFKKVGSGGASFTIKLDKGVFTATLYKAGYGNYNYIPNADGNKKRYEKDFNNWANHLRAQYAKQRSFHIDVLKDF